MNILHIDSSALGSHSASRELTAAMLGRLLRQHPQADVTYRDLDSDPLPHLSAVSLAGNDLVAKSKSDAVMQQFLDADVIVVGVPVYNFSVPGVLKAWIDRIAVAGKTFRYTENGPEGLAGGKTVLLAVTRGGMRNGDDFEEGYLRHLFAFLGIDDVRVVRADTLSFSPTHREQSMAAAHQQIASLQLASIRQAPTKSTPEQTREAA